MDRRSKSRGPAADLGAHRRSPDRATGEGRASGTRGILDTKLEKPLVFGGKSGTSTFERTSCAWAAATLDLVAAVEDPAQGPLELSNGALEQRQVSKQPWLILLRKDASLRLQRGRGPTARVPKVQFPYAGENRWQD